MISFFKNKDVYEDPNVVHYSVEPHFAAHFSTEDYFNMWCDYPASKTCSWLKEMPTMKDKMNKGMIAEKNVNLAKLDAKYRDIYAQNNIPQPQDHVKSYAHFSTAKMCPNIINVLSQSVAIKAPVDIHVSVVKHPNTEPKAHHVFVDDKFMYTHPHGRVQYTTEKSPVFTKMVNLKIETGINLHCHKDTVVMFTQPLYHNDTAPYTVVPGMFTYPLNGFSGLIFNVLMPEDTEDFIIRSGDVLFYATFSKKVKLAKTDDRKNRQIKKTLYKASETVRSLLDK
jgi:hypothetical protein